MNAERWRDEDPERSVAGRMPRAYRARMAVNWLEALLDPGIAERAQKAALAEWWMKAIGGIFDALAMTAKDCASFEQFAAELKRLAEQSPKHGEQIAKELRAIDEKVPPL